MGRRERKSVKDVVKEKGKKHLVSREKVNSVGSGKGGYGRRRQKR